MMTDSFEVVDEIYTSQKTSILRIREANSGETQIVKYHINPSQNNRALEIEYDNLRQLDSDYTIKALKIDKWQDKTAIFLQDDKLRALSHWVGNKKLKLETFFKIAININQAILVAHRAQVIHKDINLSNFITDKYYDKIKLIDFEFASFANSEKVGFSAASKLQGTLTHIAPEQTGRINKNIDQRCDLYAMGICFYQLLAGRLPFEDLEYAELIFAHIAKQPPSLAEYRSDIPAALLIIIDKLLQKSADERYQSAESVAMDLQFVRDHLTSSDELLTFEVATGDKHQTLTLPDQLFGRRQETQVLIELFQACQNQTKISLVTGVSGIGKTALIEQLFEPITARQGFFLRGKFDQLNKNLAYTALADTLTDFVEQCLGLDESFRKRVKREIRALVGDSGQVITDIVPAMGLLIGESKTLTPMPPLETLTRRDYLFSRLFRVICKLGPPVVIFLDDLQWADDASLTLISKVCEDEPKNLMLIFSYRHNELSPLLPAEAFISDIKGSSISITPTHLEPLDEPTISNWCENLIGNDSNLIENLSDQLWLRASGNPFHTTSLMQSYLDQELIWRDTSGRVHIELEKIIATPMGSIIDHLVAKIADLADNDSELIKRASIFGHRFNMHDITKILGIKDKTLHKSFNNLVAAKLIIKMHDQYLFSHDRVQQAAATLLDRAEAEKLHLTAGNAILKAQQLAGKDLVLQNFVHHLNHGIALIEDIAQKLRLCDWNLSLGQQYKSSAAYGSAEQAFLFALNIAETLTQNGAEEARLFNSIYTELGEINFLKFNYDEGERYFGLVFSGNASLAEKTKAHIIRIKHYASDNDLNKSLALGLETLSGVGIHLPHQPHQLAILPKLVKIKFQLRHTNPDYLLELPSASDPLTQSRMKILTSVLLASALSHPEYLPLLGLEMLNLSIKKGTTAASPIATLIYGLIHCNIGQVERGYQYARVALQQQAQFEAKMPSLQGQEIIGEISESKAILYLMYAALIHHHYSPRLESLDYFDTAVNSGTSSGEYEYAAGAACMAIFAAYHGGINIGQILAEKHRRLDTLSALGKENPLLMAEYQFSYLESLTHIETDGDEIPETTLTETQFYNLLESQGSHANLAVCYLNKTQLNYLLGDLDKAQVYKNKLVSMTSHLSGTFYIANIHWLAALVELADCHVNPGRRNNKKSIKTHMKTLATLAKTNPDNVHYKLALIQAEWHSLHGRTATAVDLYESAMQSAMAARNLMDIAMIFECWGRHFVRETQLLSARIHIDQAIAAYRTWGVIKKSILLADEFADLTNENQRASLLVSRSEETLDIHHRLDLDALVSGINSLAASINIDKLLAILLDLMLKNSGANHSAYLHVQDGIVQVRGQKEINQTIVLHDGPAAHLTLFKLQNEEIRSCLFETKMPILKNLRSTNKSSKLTSLLIVPLIRQDQVVGAIYLENNLLADAFRPDNIQIVTLLASQAAIAIENTLAFSQLVEEQDYSSKLLQRAPGIICGLDNNGNFIFLNPSTTDITGYTEAELLSQSCWQLLFPGHAYKQVQALFEKLARGDVYGFEMILTTRAGKQRDIIWNAFRKSDTTNNEQQLLLFGTDVTDQNIARKKVLTINEDLTAKVAARTQALQHSNLELEDTITTLNNTRDRLVETEKMAAMAGLVAGVAHEINTPLGISITGVSHFMTSTNEIVEHYDAQTMTQDQLEKYFASSQQVAALTFKNLERTANLVSTFKQMSIDKNSDNLRRFNLHRHVSEILLGLDKNLKRADISIKLNIDTTIELNSYPSVYTQIINNLVQNALQHAFTATENSIITIGASLETQVLLLTVTDNGCGISDQDQARIFDPFYTSRSVSSNTGLGLNLAYNLITQKLRGQIRCESTLKQGTRFILNLPLDSEWLMSS